VEAKAVDDTPRTDLQASQVGTRPSRCV